MKMSKSLTAADERAYEKVHIWSQRERYLKTDPCLRANDDRGYSQKIQLIRDFLSHSNARRILDFGANTSGEAEVLVSEGWSIIAMDINEYALAISQARCSQQSRPAPHYVGGDGHKIPLRDSSVDSVVCYEALHHMENPAVTAAEVHRVLAKGGSALFVEPYSWNPYRRLSQIRDFLRGTIEKSFSSRALVDLMREQDFWVETIRREVMRPSDWKLAVVPPWRRLLKWLYYWTSVGLKPLFGNLVLVARRLDGSPMIEGSFVDLLVCPLTGTAVEDHGDRFISTGDSERFAYPAFERIPVLIAADAQSLPFEDRR